MDGQIWFLSRSLQLTSFQAYKLRVTHLYQLKQHSILVSVGQDEHGINPLVNPLLVSRKGWRSGGRFCLLFKRCMSMLCLCVYTLCIRSRCGTRIRETAVVLCVLVYFQPFLETNLQKCPVLVYTRTSTSWPSVQSFSRPFFLFQEHY